MPRWLCVCAILTLACPGVWPPGGRAEKVLGEEDDEFDFDGLPGAQHEFKVEIGAGREQCYFQMVKAGGRIHVSFEVLRGGDETVDAASIRHPNGEVLEEARTRTRHGFYVESEVTGPYAICLDNTNSRIHSKLAYVYIVTYVEQEWEQYNKEILDLQLTVINFTTSLSLVSESIQAMKQQQFDMRRNVVRDWHLIMGANTHVQRWSIMQCVVVITCSCVQVYFVRRLFRYVNITPSNKPRA